MPRADPKNESADKRKERARNKTGVHDHTIASDDEGPGAKKSLRERITETYENKVKSTKAAREADGSATVTVQSAQFDIEQVRQKI